MNCKDDSHATQENQCTLHINCENETIKPKMTTYKLCMCLCMCVFGMSAVKLTCRFSLSLKLFITEKFRHASLDFLRRGPRNGSKFCMIPKWINTKLQIYNTITARCEIFSRMPTHPCKGQSSGNDSAVAIIACQGMKGSLFKYMNNIACTIAQWVV